MAIRRVGALLVACLAGLVGCADPVPPGPRDVLTAAERAALASEPAGGDVLVAVVDGGVDTTHPALRDRVVRTWRAPGLTAERGTHGTQVAGVLAGSATAEWSGGLAPDARLLDVQVLDHDGQGSADDLAAGLRFARTAEADLVLTSLALGWDAPAVRAAVGALVLDGVLVVASSGNGFDDLPAFPAAYPGVLGVAALDRDGRRLTLSAWAGADAASARGRGARAGPGRGLRPGHRHLGGGRGRGRPAGGLRRCRAPGRRRSRTALDQRQRRGRRPRTTQADLSWAPRRRGTMR